MRTPLSSRAILVFWRAALALALVTVTSRAAVAQTGRVGGLIKDEAGQPIKSAIVTAEFLDVNINSVTATTDERGRFAMVGLRFGEWSFRVQAQGYSSQLGNMNVRTGGINPPMTFTLIRTVESQSALGSIAAKDVQASLAAADALYTSQRWDEAITAYRSVLSDAPVLTSINLQIASAYRSKKDYDAAIAAYQALLKSDPSNPLAKVGLAMAHADKGDLATAEKTLEDASLAQGDSRDVFFQLGEVKLARAKPDDAVKAYTKAADIDPTWGKPQLALGRLAMTRGDRDVARKALQTVVAVDPTSAEAGQANALLQQLGR